jgi:hypothetical protein
MADTRLREALRKGCCSPSVAEAAAKLSQSLQRRLMDRFVSEEMKRLTMRDVQEIKEARSHAAVDALPRELFTVSFDLPVNGNGYHAGEDQHQWLRQVARQLWETLLELERTGGLDLKSNKQSRQACSDARRLITEIKGNMNGQIIAG